jgi:hypothetical protein
MCPSSDETRVGDSILVPYRCTVFVRMVDEESGEQESEPTLSGKHPPVAEMLHEVPLMREDSASSSSSVPLYLDVCVTMVDDRENGFVPSATMDSHHFDETLTAQLDKTVTHLLADMSEIFQEIATDLSTHLSWELLLPPHNPVDEEIFWKLMYHNLHASVFQLNSMVKSLSTVGDIDWHSVVRLIKKEHHASRFKTFGSSEKEHVIIFPNFNTDAVCDHFIDLTIDKDYHPSCQFSHVQCVSILDGIDENVPTKAKGPGVMEQSRFGVCCFLYERRGSGRNLIAGGMENVPLVQEFMQWVHAAIWTLACGV